MVLEAGIDQVSHNPVGFVSNQLPGLSDARQSPCLCPSFSPISNGIRPAPLVLTVAKSDYRRVIRKAGVERRWPFRVLSPVLTTGSSVAEGLWLAISASRARLPGLPVVTRPTRFPPKLSVVSLSRVGWVNGCWLRQHRSQPPGVAFG